MTDPADRLAAALADRYTLERELGHGGMATVYLAQDLKHDRKVALKVLRPELAAVIGAERFLAEIKTTANLQHPHILPLFESGRSGEFLFYVMPFVEGESLRDRLNREKQLPIADAVRIATEVASALDYAHRHHIIHRDIKPENILLHDGSALVADFGIALAVSQAGGARMTETGLSLGTPQYMSPEQAMAEREISARSDVYALGAVTYEMLLGEPPFTGPNAQAMLARSMTERPASLIARRDRIPPEVEEAVLTALEKLPADRWSSATEFAAVLGGGPHASPRIASATSARAAAGRASGRRSVLLVALTAALALVGGWFLGRRDHGAWGALPPTRLALLVPTLGASGAAGLYRHIGLATDGSAVVYVGAAGGATMGSALWIQRLDQTEPRRIPGSEFLYAPRLSPDGRWVAANNPSGDVVRLPLEGATVQPAPLVRGLSFVAWHPDGSLWISRTPFRTMERIPAGGDSVEVRVSGLKRGAYVQQILDDGVNALLVQGDGSISGPVVLMNLATGRLTTIIEEAVISVHYTMGYLVYTRPDGTLLAAPYDLRRTRIAGEAVTIAAGVSVTGVSDAQFEVARNGTVLYIPEEPRTLIFVDRSGTARPATETHGSFHAPSFAPDGRRVAVDMVTADGRDVWILEPAQGTLSRATFERDGHDAVWTPDGRQITFSSYRSGTFGVYRTRSGSAAPAESLLASSQELYTGYWRPDGSGLVTVAADLRPGSGQDIGLVTNGGHGPIEPIVATRFHELYPALSPDGRWVAFVSDQSGQSRVYLRPLEGEGDEIQVSQGDAQEPVWGPDGRELFYRATVAGRTELILARLAMTPAVRVVDRRALFPVDNYLPAAPHANYGISPDGKTFVMIQRNPATRMMVIQNLPALVARLRDARSAPH